MPFKIIQTYNEQQNKQVRKIRSVTLAEQKICKIEDSTPQPNWTKINCIVKRNITLCHTKLLCPRQEQTPSM